MLDLKRLQKLRQGETRADDTSVGGPALNDTLPMDGLLQGFQPEFKPQENPNDPPLRPGGGGPGVFDVLGKHLGNGPGDGPPSDDPNGPNGPAPVRHEGPGGGGGTGPNDGPGGGPNNAVGFSPAPVNDNGADNKLVASQDGAGITSNVANPGGGGPDVTKGGADTATNAVVNPSSNGANAGTNDNPGGAGGANANTLPPTVAGPGGNDQLGGGGGANLQPGGNDVAITPDAANLKSVKADPATTNGEGTNEGDTKKGPGGQLDNAGGDGNLGPGVEAGTGKANAAEGGGGDGQVKDGGGGNDAATVDGEGGGGGGTGDGTVAVGGVDATGGAGGGGGVNMGPVASPKLGVPGFMAPVGPPLPDAVIDQITQATGKTPQQHAQLVQAQITRLVSHATMLQSAAVQRAQSAAQAATSQLEAGRSSLISRVDGARSGLTGAIDGARGAVTAAADAAKAAILDARKSAYGAIAVAAANATKKVNKFYNEQAARYGAMDADLLKPFKTVLTTHAGNARTDGTAKSKELKATDTSAAVDVGKGDALLRYVASCRKQWIDKDLAKAVADMAAGGETRAKEIEAAETPLHDNIKATLAPIIERVGQLGTEGTTAVDGAKAAAQGKLWTDSQQALTTVDAALAGALQHLDAVQAATTTDLDGITGQVHADVDARKQAAQGAFLGAGARFADQIRAYVKDTRDRFPQGGPLTIDAVQGYFDQAQKGLDGLQASQVAELDALNNDARTRFQQGVQAMIGAIDGVKASAEGAIQQAIDAQVTGFGELSTGFATSLGILGPSVTSALEAWLAPVKAQLSAHEAQTRKQNETVKTNLDTEFGTQHTAWVGLMDTTITEYLSGAIAKSYEGARPAEEKVEDRAKKAYEAMRGCGTDENKLFDALRNMAEGEPQATTQVFGSISGGESLDAWMRDDLNDEEYAIATAHYNRDHGAAARAEIDYNVSFWGDDEAQIEKIMRGLPEDERKEILGKNKEEWSGTLELLKDNLDGNDLMVVDALAENNVSKADAIRLKETIDKARYEGDNDKVHEALEGMDQDKIDEISAEFAKLDGVGADGAPADPTEAKKEMASYINRDIELPPDLGGKRTMDQGSKDLVDALILSGKDSVDTRVARFNREMTRPGGPNDEKLEKALYVNEGLKEALHDPDPEKKKLAQEQAAAQQKEFNEKYEAKYKTNPTAVITGKDGVDANKKDLYSLMLKDGYNSPEVAALQIDIARTGAGTDEDAMKRAMKGMNKDEVDKTKVVFKQNTGEDFEEALGLNGKGGFFTELSGQDRMDMEKALLGDEKYMSDDDRMALAEMQYDDQKGSESTMLGRGVMGSSYENKALDENMSNLKAFKENNKDKFKDGKFDGSPEEYEEYRRLCRYVGITADLYQQQSDRIANYATTAIAVAGAVAGAILSGGTLAPMLIAGVTGLASAGTNYAMKGGRYGWEQGVTDLAVTGVNVLTAGVGAKITEGIDEAYKLGSLGTGTMITQKSLVAGGQGFLDNAASTGFQDATWNKGVGHGIGETFYSGSKGFATGFSSTMFSEGISKVDFKKGGLADYKGQGSIEKLMSADHKPGFQNKFIDKTLHTGRVGVTKGLVDGTSGMISKSTEIGIDAMFGKYNGELYNAFEEIGLEGLKSAGKGFAGGTTSVLGKPMADSYTKWREDLAAKREAKKNNQANVEQQSTRKEEHLDEHLQQTKENEQKKLQDLTDDAEDSKVVVNGEEKVDPSKTLNEDEVHHEVEQSKDKIEALTEETERQKNQLHEEQKDAQDQVDKVEQDLSKVDQQDKTTTEGDGVHPPVGGETDTKKPPTQWTEDEIMHHLSQMERNGDLSHEACLKIMSMDKQDMVNFIMDDYLLQRMITLRDNGAVSDNDIDNLLSLDDPTAMRKQVEQLEYQSHSNDERYPKALKQAKDEQDGDKKLQLVQQTIEHFEVDGQGAAVNALKKLDGNPDAQLQLAEDLAIYHIIIAKPTRQISDQELVHLVRAVNALSQNSEGETAVLRKFINDWSAQNYANNGKYSNSVKGCIGDASNTEGLTPKEVIRVLGLDYNDDAYVTKNGDGSFSEKEGPMFFIEFANTDQIQNNAKITVATDLYDRIQELAGSMPEAQNLMKRLGKKDVFDGDQNQPYTGTGGTAPGGRLGKGEGALINHEMDASAPSDLPPGTVLYRLDEKGQKVPYATFDGTTWTKTDAGNEDAKLKPPETK